MNIAASTLAALRAKAGLTTNAVPVAAPVAAPSGASERKVHVRLFPKRAPVPPADGEKLVNFLTSEAKFAQEPFHFRGYERLDMGATPQGCKLVENSAFLSQLLEVCPKAECRQSQLIAALEPAVDELVKRFGRVHELFGGIGPKCKQHHLNFRKQLAHTVYGDVAGAQGQVLRREAQDSYEEDGGKRAQAAACSREQGLPCMC